ncbi:MAG: hypothetical protein JWO38_2154 [Gemmataceae bacterium]|nr:hypothetical protein [Gemmataceae bacterium]
MQTPRLGRPARLEAIARREGMTLLEVVAVIGILAVLVGLLLPAVQKVRAAAARSSCQNSLRQVALAAHTFEQAAGEIPLSWCGIKDGDYSCFSAQSKLLPHLEAGDTFRAIDWSDQSLDGDGGPPVASAANRPLLTRTIPILVCPADGEARPGANSYRISVGRKFVVTLNSPTVENDPLPRRLIHITDGLSNTALFSERLVGAPGGRGRRNLLNIAAHPEQLGLACTQAQVPPAVPVEADSHAGWTWLRGSDRHAQYAHLYPPNSRLLDCNTTWLVGWSLITARSNHPGGVNVAFADGHTVFISDQIDLAAWRAMGTPNGGEPIQPQ